jgi:4-hydroxybenzoate polyprenyltransferase
MTECLQAREPAYKVGSFCRMPLPSMSSAPRSRLSLYLDLIRWNRPAGWLVLVWPTLVALWVAADGFPGWHLLTVFVLGTVLMRSAGCCINDVADRDFDRHVKRTQARPITSGQVSVKEALLVGAVLALVSLGLVLSTRWEAVAWSVPAVLFTILYPFTKRFFAMPQAFLGIAFNFGIVIAYAAVRGEVPLEAWLLWLANMCLVLAYDTEYAMVDRDDDLKIGMKTSAITLGRFDVLGVMLFFVLCWALTAWVLLGLGLGWPVWLGLAVAAAQIAWHYTLIKGRTREGCFVAFSKSHWIGVALFAGVALGYLLRA